ncbi:hydroxymethylbilane synthase [Microbacterium gorillae]|uniref:hydroxymethylbilane synthase n=1 Tax=Microbacterium gorillae TaxID=1231063 RepID=UPI000590A2EA|nr:hydroxymethylbilane synthase [Microbacterium gorillae]
MTLRLGTRASLLALTQSRLVADAITAASGAEVELVQITSDGDRLTGSLAQLGGTGVFASALREALLGGECDLLVHSMKDLPTAQPPGIVIAAVPVRASAADALCGPDGAPITLAGLRSGARVGTGSPRRAAQILSRRPDLRVLDIRGNVDTRLRKLDDGQYDAIVLAEAGLRRIGRDDRIGEVLDWPTSAAQGALAIEVRSADAAVAAAVAAVSDADTDAAARTERAVLRHLEAGCAAPVAIRAAVADTAQLAVEVYAPDGSRVIRAVRAELPAAEVRSDAARDALAAAVVAELRAAGVDELMPTQARG